MSAHQAYRASSEGNGAGVSEGNAVAIPCPCCGQAVAAPSLEIVIDHFKVTPLEASILGVLWRRRGRAVMTDHIYEAIYGDRKTGRPCEAAMYSAFKVGLCHLRAKLRGSGISIENVGYRQGYRIPNASRDLISKFFSHPEEID